MNYKLQIHFLIDVTTWRAHVPTLITMDIIKSHFLHQCRLHSNGNGFKIVQKSFIQSSWNLQEANHLGFSCQHILYRTSWTKGMERNMHMWYEIKLWKGDDWDYMHVKSSFCLNCDVVHGPLVTVVNTQFCPGNTFFLFFFLILFYFYFDLSFHLILLLFYFYFILFLFLFLFLFFVFNFDFNHILFTFYLFCFIPFSNNMYIKNVKKNETKKNNKKKKRKGKRERKR